LSQQEGAAPFDRLDPAGLVKSVQVALAAGLFDDLGWLAPEDVAVALYEIAGALPLGAERREIGRRVLSTLYEGKAATFLALATRMSSGAARGLSGAGIRRASRSRSACRRSSAPSPPIRFASPSRRGASSPSTGSRGDRRPRRAARDGAHPRARGPRGRRARAARRRPRHGALRGSPRRDPRRRGSPRPRVALSSRRSRVLGLAPRRLRRGLLAEALPQIAAEIEADLSPELSPTEWRRAATSLAASMAVDPQRALARAVAVLAGPLVKRDPASSSR